MVFREENIENIYLPNQQKELHFYYDNNHWVYSVMNIAKVACMHLWRFDRSRISFTYQTQKRDNNFSGKQLLKRIFEALITPLFDAYILSYSISIYISHTF